MGELAGDTGWYRKLGRFIGREYVVMVSEGKVEPVDEVSGVEAESNPGLGLRVETSV